MSALEQRPALAAGEAGAAGGTGPDEAEAVRAARVAGLAGASALVAGIAHLAVTPHHLIEAPVIGLLFLGLGLLQLGLGAAFGLVRSVRAQLGVLLVHLTVVASYIASRTVELPFIPPHDAAHQFPHLPVAGGVGDGVPTYPGARIEGIGFVDMLCLVAELVLVAAVTALLPERVRARVTALMLALAATALMLRVVLVVS